MISRLAALLVGGTVLVGVGDLRHGDDAAGPLVVRRLAEAGVADVIDAGNTPESETARIRELAPDAVLFVDAVDFGGQPGDAALLEPSDLRSSGFDTHRMPLKLTMQYLEAELDCTCRLLAVQPRSVALGASMCDDVERSVESLAQTLLRLLQHE